MTDSRPLLAFVSPLFLFPNDAGGKIRSTNILRGLKGGAFRVRLLSPASAAQRSQWADDLHNVCDEFVGWQPAPTRPRWLRGFDLFGSLPVNVAADRTAPALAAVRADAARGDADVIVHDFVHASVLRPAGPARHRSVCFTHNVEAEIFARHAQQARDPLRRWLWISQHRKMKNFEGAALRGYDKVIAVSDRDARQFAQAYGVQGAEAIPTGVDLGHFTYQAPLGDSAVPTVVFTGSMDSAANIDGVQFFLAEVWPRVVATMPQARFKVVGRRPPSSLVALGGRSSGVEFTGFVDDVRPHVRTAQVSVMPLQVGGGTRIKAFEAMAMGSPVVSTSVGIEGLAVEPGVHFLCADTAAAFAEAVLQLLGDAAARQALASRARALVEARFGHKVAAAAFEAVCLRTLGGDRAAAPSVLSASTAGSVPAVEPAAV